MHLKVHLYKGFYLYKRISIKGSFVDIFVINNAILKSLTITQFVYLSSVHFHWETETYNKARHNLAKWINSHKYLLSTDILDAGWPDSPGYVKITEYTRMLIGKSKNH